MIIWQHVPFENEPVVKAFAEIILRKSDIHAHA